MVTRTNIFQKVSASPSVASTKTSNPPVEAPPSNNLMDALASALNQRKTKVAQSGMSGFLVFFFKSS